MRNFEVLATSVVDFKNRSREYRAKIDCADFLTGFSDPVWHFVYHGPNGASY